MAIMKFSAKPGEEVSSAVEQWQNRPWPDKESREH
jgi:hypothetical protein